MILLKVARKEYELFDSLGSTQTYVQDNIPFKGICKVNKTPLQKDSTSSCGEFCLYFIINRLYNLDLSFEHFLSDFFTENQDINERRIHLFFDHE